MKIRALLVDDFPAILEMWTSLLQDSCEIVAAVRDGPSAIEAIRSFKPQVAVVDLGLPGLNGLDVTRRATGEVPGVAIVICSTEHSPSLVEAAIMAGAKGYVAKADMLRNLAHAVKAVAAGETFFSHREVKV